MIKKIGTVGIIQIILIVVIIVSFPIFLNFNLDLNILAVIIAILALLIPLLNEVNKAIDSNKKTNVRRIYAETYNLNLGELIEKEIEELKKQNKVIDSVKIIDDKNRGGNSEVIIIYH